jgi:glycosyltransferase involved in cell wall biosynthesis
MSGYEYMYEADHQISSGLFPISVFIPFYNGHAWIREALLSVLAQKIPPAEIIIVDDCSPQPLDAEEISNLSNDDVIDYQAILSKIFDQVPGPPTRPLGKKSRPVIHIARHPVNKGIAATRNTGVRLSSQPFIMFLDQDDIWLPDKTVLQMRALKEAQTDSPALVYGWIWTLRAKDGKLNRLKRTMFRHRGRSPTHRSEARYMRCTSEFAGTDETASSARRFRSMDHGLLSQIGL